MFSDSVGETGGVEVGGFCRIDLVPRFFKQTGEIKCENRSGSYDEDLLGDGGLLLVSRPPSFTIALGELFKRKKRSPGFFVSFEWEIRRK